MMCVLIQGKPTNMPFMMLEQIKEVAKRSRCSCYGMVFTLIFTEFGDGLEEEDLKRLVHTYYYNDRSLYHIGYRKVDGRWIWRGLG